MAFIQLLAFVLQFAIYVVVLAFAIDVAMKQLKIEFSDSPTSLYQISFFVATTRFLPIPKSLGRVFRELVYFVLPFAVMVGLLHKQKGLNIKYEALWVAIISVSLATLIYYPLNYIITMILGKIMFSLHKTRAELNKTK
jgi:hypothetical protein